MKKPYWKYFYAIGWLLGITSMILPFGTFSWMDSGTHEVPGFSYIQFILVFTLLSPAVLIYIAMFISFLFPRISSRSKVLKIFTLLITATLWFNPGIVRGATIGYYVWVASLSLFTLAVWSIKNGNNKKMHGSIG